MSRRDFDPSELGGEPLDREAADELQRYARLADGDASPAFADRVMAAVEQAPPPRRGFLAWLRLPSAGPMRGLAQAVVLAGALALMAGGVLAAGELARWLRGSNLGGSPSPAPSESFVPSPSVSPEGSASDDPASPSESEPEASPQPSGSVPGSASANPSAVGSAASSPSETPDDSGSPDESETATPSQTETPEPTPSATPTQSP